MIVNIDSHAVDKYIERVLQEPDKTSDYYLREEAATQILLAVADPDVVYHGDKEMSQIHIKNNCEIPVGIREQENGDIYPYESLNQDLYVPTCYPSGVFKNKLKSEEGKKVVSDAK